MWWGPAGGEGVAEGFGAGVGASVGLAAGTGTGTAVVAGCAPLRPLMPMLVERMFT